MVMVFNASPAPMMFLKLVQEGTRVCLILVDKYGHKVDAGNVLTISDEGVTFHGSINREAPFKMTDDREIYNCKD